MTSALVMVLLHVLGFRAEPCPTEDHIPDVGVCYWDAASMGNGQGDGFVTFDNGMRVYHKVLAR